MPDPFYTLITGASQGLGRALALECAARHMNLVLVSLPGEGLPALAATLKATFAVEAIAIETDLTETANCTTLYNEVAGRRLQVNMLINNAGVGSTEFFVNSSFAWYEQQIRLNVLATTAITHLFLPLLKKSSPAYILNVGSLASFFSLQKKQVYGATKSYISYFSKTLRRELKKDRVFVSVICPGGMQTNPTARMTLATGNYLTRASGMHPEDVAPIALDGLLRKKEVIVPGRINRTLVFLDSIVPRFVVRFFEERTMKRLHTPQPAASPQPEAAFAWTCLQTEKIVSSH